MLKSLNKKRSLFNSFCAIISNYILHNYIIDNIYYICSDCLSLIYFNLRTLIMKFISLNQLFVGVCCIIKQHKSIPSKFLILFLLFSNAIFAQKTITGKVSDSKGVAINDVTVTVKETSTLTKTDFDGNYSILAIKGNILVFYSKGFETKEVIVSKNIIHIELDEEINELSTVVISSLWKPVRKIKTTSAISNVSLKEIKDIQPESFVEAIAYSPGITANIAQGRKGSFNIRGFPSGNNYVTTLIDGLPASGISGLSSGASEFLGLDSNTERIEVVRGSAATLFGRAAGAGALNVISKKGGLQHKGSASITNYNNVSDDDHQFDGDFNYRMDINFNGPISNKLRYNIGGYLLEDSGIKESANKDKGTQIRANIDYVISKKSSIRVYGAFVNNQFQNITDIPWDLGKNELGGGFSSNNTYFNDSNQLDLIATGPNDRNGRPITKNPSEISEKVKGGLAGLDANFNIGKGWSISEKIRYQKYDFNDQNEISLTSFYTANSTIARGNIGGFQETNDFINELRFQKHIKNKNTEHSLNFGSYISIGERDRFSSFYGYLSTVGPRPTFSGFGPPGTPLSDTFRITGSTQHIEENATAFFIGDEMVINKKLSINVSLRYDILNAFATNDPGRTGVFDYDPEQLIENDLKFEDFSWSAGTNYAFNNEAALYANFLRAFSLPNTGVGTVIPENNEIINNFEIGYRAKFNGIIINTALFNTTINNRIASVFEGSGFTQQSVGKNVIRGGELDITYSPRGLKGLKMRTNATLQNSRFEEFIVPLDNIDTDGDDIPDATEADLNNLFGLKLVGSGLNRGIDVSGNQVPNTPSLILNANIDYKANNWGLNFGGSTYSGIYATSLNLYEVPNRSVYNAGVFGKISLNGTNELKLSLRVKNVFDTATPQQLVLGDNNDNLLIQKQANPNFDGVLGFGVVQAPRRILVTLGYAF